MYEIEKERRNKTKNNLKRVFLKKIDSANAGRNTVEL